MAPVQFAQLLVDVSSDFRKLELLPSSGKMYEMCCAVAASLSEQCGRSHLQTERAQPRKNKRTHTTAIPLATDSCTHTSVSQKRTASIFRDFCILQDVYNSFYEALIKTCKPVESKAISGTGLGGL
jgi:hypothetical protein